MDAASIITISLAVVAILVSLFEKNVRGWLIKLARKTVSTLRSWLKYIWFRALLLLFLVIIVLVLLHKISFISAESFSSLSLLTILLFAGISFVFKPLFRELTDIRVEIQKLKAEVRILSESKKIELEKIQTKWQDFVNDLSNQPGYQVIGAFLKLSKPVHIEGNFLLISVPEVIFKASSNFDLERVTPMLKNFFGVEYKLKLSVV